MSFEDIIKDFNSLEDCTEITKFPRDNNDKNMIQEAYEKYYQSQDFRRPKLQENTMKNTFSKLNRSYSVKEFKTNGIELMPLQTGKSLQKFSDHSHILSEFIL